MTKKFYLNFLHEALKLENYHSWEYNNDFCCFYQKDRIKIEIEPGLISDIIKIYDSDKIVYKKPVYYYISEFCKSVNFIKKYVHVNYITNIFKK